MTTLFLPSANWYCSQLCAWGFSLSVPEKVYFAYGCKSQVAIYEMEKTSEDELSEPMFYADFTRGKHDKRVTSVAFMTGSAGELVLICSGEEGSIQLWDVATKKMVERYKKHKTEIMAVSTLNGNSIVAGDRNGVISVNQRENGLITVNTPLTGDCIYCLAGTPGTDKKIAIGYRSGQIITWDVVSNSIAFRLKSHDEEVHAVSWYELDGTIYLATSSRDKKLCVWHEDNLVMESTLPKVKKNMSVHQMNRLWFTHTWIKSEQNLRIVSSSLTGDLYNWEWSPKKKRSKLSVAPTIINSRHSRQIFNIAAFSIGKSTYLATSSMDRDVRMLHLPSMASHVKLSGLGGHVYTLKMNPEGVLAAGIGDNTIRLIHNLNEPQSTSSMLWKGLQSKITAIAWHPLCDTIVAYGCEDGYFGYYNTSTNQLVRFKSYHSSMVYQVSWKAIQTKPNADDWLQALKDIEQGNRDILDEYTTSTSPSGVELWSCAGDGSLWSVNPDTPETAATSINKRWSVNNITSFAWKQDSDICVIGTTEGIVQIYDNGVKIHQYMNHTKAVSRICWFENLMASCSYDAMIFVYDLSHQCPITYTQAFHGHGSGVTDLAWSSNGKYLASSSMDGTVQVWPLGQHERGYNFRQHSGRVLSVAWCDLECLVSAGEDQTIRQWKFSEQVFTMPPESKQESASSKVKETTKKNATTPAKTLQHRQNLFHSVEQYKSISDESSNIIATESKQFIEESNWESAARLLILQGRIIEALRMLAKEGKLSSEWISYAPMAGIDAWKEFTRLYANQLLVSGDFQNAALHWTTIGEVHQAIECLCKGNYWREAIALILLRCSPNDPILKTKQLEYAVYLEKKNELEEAGLIYSRYNRIDQALACFIKANSPSAFEAALNTTTNGTIQMDIINRALSLGYTSVVPSATQRLGKDHASQLFLKMYCLCKENNIAIVDDPSASPISLPLRDDMTNCIELLPPLLRSVFDNHKQSWFWHFQQRSDLRRLISNIDEDNFEEVIDGKFQSYIRSSPNESKIVLILSNMAVDLYHGYLISAFETWATFLTEIMKSTEEAELIQAFVIVFPSGVTLQPAPTGELVDDESTAKELWASFFLLQSIGLARAVRQKDNTLEQQESLLFLTQWINREFSPEVLLQFSPEIVQLTQVASNELSLLYHQLLDSTPESALSE
ncbi:hypothetical protein THRCLA_01780 [Thraustotheca clavata]|uniref:Gem-associated protein 5 TPR domain-containing protein n=1 Tax=Thraustotheca clavata TaxID=74557 RepID=A0A1W0A7F6_9STRA|nr:hypothetical protein THRCLA_01780 [Thraustotheca clavata]